MTALHSRREVLSLVGAAAGVSGVGPALAARSSAETTPTDGTTETEATATGTERTTDPDTAAGQTPLASAGDHPTFGVDAARTGYEPDERGPAAPVRPAWCVGADGAHDLAPLAVVDGTVFTGNASDGLRALDAATGAVRWRASLDAGSPTVVGDRVFTTDRRAVYGLGIGSGRELWSATPGEAVTSSVLVAGVGDGSESPEPTAFVTTPRPADDGDGGARTGTILHALDTVDGTTRWTVSVEGGTVYGSLAARDGIVYGGSATWDFYAFDATSAAVRWRADLGEHPTSPAVGSEAVFVGDESGTVHARDRRTGAERWTYDAGAEVRTAPAVADGTVYVAATDGHLHAIDAASGVRRWRFDGGRRLTCAPTVVGREDLTVFVGSGEGNVFGVEAATGDLLWSHQLTDRVETRPVVADGGVFVGDNEGRLHALVGGSTAVADDAGGCAVPTTTPRAASRDADGDGVPDRDDYAPRDASVQRRSDLEADAADDRADGGDDREFLAGVGVGAAVSILGMGSGWWLRGRKTESGSERGPDENEAGDGNEGDED